MTTLAPTLSVRYFPRTATWIRDLFLIVFGSLFVAALAQVEIPLPFTPVPITGQTFGVLIIGAALGSKRGALSLALYLAEGIIGLPFFAGLHRRSLYHRPAGRTRTGTKRSHFIHSVFGRHSYHLCLWHHMVIGCVRKFQQSRCVGHSPILDRGCD